MSVVSGTSSNSGESGEGMKDDQNHGGNRRKDTDQRISGKGKCVIWHNKKLRDKDRHQLRTEVWQEVVDSLRAYVSGV